jgi:hypothetical protein
MAGSGTLLPLPGDKANGRLWSTKLPKQHDRFQVAAEGHFMTATREFRKRARNAILARFALLRI